MHHTSLKSSYSDSKTHSFKYLHSSFSTSANESVFIHFMTMETMKKDGNINCEVIMKSHYDTRTNNISDFKTKTMNMLQHTYVITLKFLHIYH